MVATLVAVGRNSLAADDIPGLMEGADRTVMPSAAPAHALFLADVQYDECDLHFTATG
jgi:tRNA U38,U39,U40 pseudouridine synthase TruA